MAKVVFHCKDPLIVRYCEQEFGPQFTKIVQGFPDDPASALKLFEQRLTTEAHRQEWFDYTIEPENSGLGDGVTHSRRRLIRDHEGRVEYLVPTVVIEND